MVLFSYFEENAKQISLLSRVAMLALRKKKNKSLWEGKKRAEFIASCALLHFYVSVMSRERTRNT